MVKDRFRFRFRSEAEIPLIPLIQKWKIFQKKKKQKKKEKQKEIKVKKSMLPRRTVNWDLEQVRKSKVNNNNPARFTSFTLKGSTMAVCG